MWERRYMAAWFAYMMGVRRILARGGTRDDAEMEARDSAECSILDARRAQRLWWVFGDLHGYVAKELQASKDHAAEAGRLDPAAWGALAKLAAGWE